MKHLVFPILFLSMSIILGQSNNFPTNGNVTINDGHLIQTGSSNYISTQGPIKLKNYLLFDGDGDFTGSNYYTIQDDPSGNFLRMGYGFSNHLTIGSTGNVGIGTSSPRTKFHVLGPSETQSGYVSTFGNLSSSDLITSNSYRSFSGSTFTDGNSGTIDRYFSYRSIYGGYLNYNNQGFGFYSQGHYPRMFMEVISGNHGGIGQLPSDSPIKSGYLYQQIKGPSINGALSPVKATNGNSQWLWGVSSSGSIIVAGKVESREVKVTIDAGADYVFKEDYELRSLEEVQNYIRENGHLPNIPSAKEMEANGIQLGEMNMKLLEKIEELTLYTLEQEEKLKAQNSKIENLKGEITQIKESLAYITQNKQENEKTD